MKREEYTLELYEVMGYDAEWDTWGFHGSEVYHKGHRVGLIPWETPEDLEAMDDDHLENIFNEYGIL